MKRAIYTLLVLIAGAGLGGGGLYLGMNWDKFNPFRAQDTREPLQRLVALLRKSCVSEPELKGAAIKSAEVADGKLTLRGVVASKKQLEVLETRVQELMAETPDLQSQCASGIATDGIKVLAILDQVAALQRDFDEARGAQGEDDFAKGQVMRATRLDGIAITEEGKITFSGVCLRSEASKKEAGDQLRSVLAARIEAMGVPATSMPDLALDMKFITSPAVAVQKQFSQDKRGKGMYMVAATYDAAGKLHVTGLVNDEAQRKLVLEAIDAYAKAPLTSPAVKLGAGNPNYVVDLQTFQAEARVLELQKQLVEHARTTNKPHLRRASLDQIVPTPLQDARKQIQTDDDGNVLYYFRVRGRLFETAGERELIETELKAWLIDQLPKVMNADKKPLVPVFAFDVKESPIFAIQKRIVARGLDGAVMTDALFDERGQLELIGRAQQPDEIGRQALLEVVKQELSARPWNIHQVKAHESGTQGQPIAWRDVLQQCRAKLATDTGIGQRLRLDRLYFAYENQQLRLIGDGLFLATMPMENTDGALRSVVDAIIASRSNAQVKSSGVRHVKNPTFDLQDASTENPGLDGVVFVNARFDAEGVLQLDGNLGATEQRTVLTPLVAQQLDKLTGAAMKSAWSIDGMKPHAAVKGTWRDVLGACQADLAAEPGLRKACLTRAYFKYLLPNSLPRPMLTLQCQASVLIDAKDVDDATLKLNVEKKMVAVHTRFLKGVPTQEVHAALTRVPSPVMDLQKHAVAKGYDGILFRDAHYDRDGKLAVAGIRGSAEHLKQAKELIDQHLAADKSAIAPAGVAPIDNLKLVPWQPMLADVRGQFAQEKTVLYKQTRIDRAYFEYDKSGKAVLHFKGICIYQGKVLMPEQQYAGITDKLKKQLALRGIDTFDLDVTGIDRMANPVLDMQKKATENMWDGIVFSEIGFDATGACFVRLPFPPKGQEENIRSLIDEFSKKNKHLGKIQQK